VIVANMVAPSNDRCISREEGEGYAISIRARHYEISAKTEQSIDLLFQHVCGRSGECPRAGVRDAAWREGFACGCSPGCAG